MFARIRARLMAVLVVAGTLGGVALGGAVPVSASSDSIQRQVNALLDELDRLEDQMDGISEQYAEALSAQDDLIGEIEEAKVRVAAKEAELSGMRQDLYGVAKQAFMAGGRGNSLTSLLTDVGGLNAMVQREHYISVALNAGANTSDELDALVEDLNIERKSLERKKDAAKKQATVASDRFRNAEDLANAYQRKLSEAQSELGDALQAERNRRDEAALARAKSVSAKYQSQAVNYKVKAPSSRAGIAVQAALAQIGTPYQYARSSPGVAFDCSGLTLYAWGKAGVSLPHYSRAQYQRGPKIPIAAAQPGDLIFSRTPIGHVSLYIGGGRMVHAPRRGDVVRIAPVDWDRVVGVTRPG
jgi:cell wall-associated NlpC family hydrolase